MYLFIKQLIFTEINKLELGCYLRTTSHHDCQVPLAHSELKGIPEYPHQNNTVHVNIRRRLLRPNKIPVHFLIFDACQLWNIQSVRHETVVNIDGLIF